jgi:catechol 2,3-dioxygenase-like lactoylglutathione lyase family enzyme
MRIKRVVANIETSDVDKADAFYRDVLGLERVMDNEEQDNLSI